MDILLWETVDDLGKTTMVRRQASVNTFDSPKKEYSVRAVISIRALFVSHKAVKSENKQKHTHTHISMAVSAGPSVCLCALELPT